MTERRDLSDLVARRAAELSLSLRELAARCVDSEDPDDVRLPWSVSTLGELKNGNKRKQPTPSQIRALAAGLDVPVSVVRDAAGAQYVGVDAVWDPSGEIRALVHGYEDLTPEDQQMIRDLIEVRRRRKA